MAVSEQHLTPDVRLKRFLYTSNEEPVFITGDPELHHCYTLEKIGVVPEILQSNNPHVVLNLIEIANSNQLVPRRNNILFTLAVVATYNLPEKFKQKIFATLLNVIKTAEDLCTFLKFYSIQKKKVGSFIMRVISTYYLKKDPMELAEEVAWTKGHHKWTHKDLVKLAHCRSESVFTTIVLHYILYGLERAKAVAEGNALAIPLIEKISKIHELKRCENEKRIVELILELQCDNLKQVPSFYHQSQLVWDAIMPTLQLRILIAYLPRLYKLGFLKANTPFQSKVMDCLTNVETIQSSHLHPVEVFIGLRNFEKGGKPVDPKFLTYLEKMEEEKKDDPNFRKPDVSREPPRCPNIISALHKAMQISFQNLQSTGRKIMVTIEVTEKMQKACLNSKNLSCLDAAAIFTLSLLRVERDVVVTVFRDTKVTVLHMEKNVTINQALTKLKQNSSQYVLPSAPMEWALQKNKHIDVFIEFMNYHHWFLLNPKELRDPKMPIDSLNKYRRQMNLPHTKLITLSLSSPQLLIADGSLNILDIAGFTGEVPKLVEAFCKGHFY